MIPSGRIPWMAQQVSDAATSLRAEGKKQVSAEMLSCFAEVIADLQSGQMVSLPISLKDLPLCTVKIRAAPFDAWRAWVSGHEALATTARTQEAALYALGVLWEGYTPPPAPTTTAPGEQ